MIATVPALTGFSFCERFELQHNRYDLLAEGLKPTAWTEDGIVEGLEREDGWFVAVQWHPEVMAAKDPMQQALFEALVREASPG